MNELTRKFVNSLLPSGCAWNPVVDGDLDKFLQATADNIENPKEILSKLAYIRDPLRTPVLDELEIEYGVTRNENLTEEQRRVYLNSVAFPSRGTGRLEDLERRLLEAGFPVSIHSNDPSIDPMIITNNAFNLFSSGPNAFAGREDAFARRIGGEVIVNGDQFTQTPVWLSVSSSQGMFAGSSGAIAGRSDGVSLEKIEYEVPRNAGSWPLVFFIGGDATRDSNGFITSIDRVLLADDNRNEFIQLLLKYKPLHTWAVSLVDFF